MKSLYVFFVLCFTALTSYAGNEPAKVTGEIKGLENNEVILYTWEGKEVARAKSTNDKFTLDVSVDLDYGQVYYIHFPSIAPLEPSTKIPTLMFFIDSDLIEISGYINEEGVHKEKIKGSPLSVAYDEFFSNSPASKELDEITPLYQKAFHEYNYVAKTEANLQVLKTFWDRIDSLQDAQIQQIFTSIPSHSKNKALAVIVSSYSTNRAVAEQETLFNQFDPSIRHCYGMECMQRRIDLIKSSSVGAMAPDFELKDPNGEAVKLSSFRGKFVLIDFWASWCAPCRQALPLVKKTNEEFKDKGLQVIGVSVDQRTKDWMKALEEEQLPYLQLNDPESLTAKLYHYSGIPFIILISPDGVILEKELWEDEIRDAVAKYIK